MTNQTLAVIIGNRDFFPDRLVSEGRQEILAVLEEMGVERVILGDTDTKLGAVETWEDAKRCAELFKAHRDRIDGILVVLPNFGDERGIADTIKLAGLDVPILVQAYPDDLDQLYVERRRDAFCGKISVCNNLRQYGFPFTLTDEHTVIPVASELQGRPAPVRRRLPSGEGAAQRPPGRNRRAARRVQHRALQREAAPGLGHQRHHRGSLGGLWRGGQAGRRRRAVMAKLDEIRGYAQRTACRRRHW